MLKRTPFYRKILVGDDNIMAQVAPPGCDDDELLNYPSHANVSYDSDALTLHLVMQLIMVILLIKPNS